MPRLNNSRISQAEERLWPSRWRYTGDWTYELDCSGGSAKVRRRSPGYFEQIVEGQVVGQSDRLSIALRDCEAIWRQSVTVAANVTHKEVRA